MFEEIREDKAQLQKQITELVNQFSEKHQVLVDIQLGSLNQSGQHSNKWVAPFYYCEITLLL